MPEGTRALSNLKNMLLEAATVCNVSIKPTCAWEYIGLILDRKYWITILFAEPQTLWFSTCCSLDPKKARQLGIELEEKSDDPGGYHWETGADLESEEIHFFSRSKESQMKWLEEFLRKCLSKARSIESSEQPEGK